MRPIVFCLVCGLALGQPAATLSSRSRQFLTDLVRIDTTNPPGNETRVAQYLKQMAAANGIACELLGADAARLNFVARIPAAAPSGARPLLLMAHSDVVPADPSQWTVQPFSGILKGGFVYGRGAQDDKSLLAAELAVVVELKQRAVKLNRDVILLSEADEEAGSTGVTWLIRNAYSKIDAEFALNEGGTALDTKSGAMLYQIQTAEKIPTRIVLTARGVAGHGSLPRRDNAVVHLARAVVRVDEADQPVRLNTTTRRYFSQISKLPDYQWLAPLLPKLEDAVSSAAAANEIRARDPELDAMLRTTASPTMLRAGKKVNVIPNTAEAEVDVRRLPNETRQEVESRFRAIVNDPAVEIGRENGQEMPATEPSSLTTALYTAMDSVFRAAHAHAIVAPYMSRGATDGSYLRQKGMAVYGVPIFVRQGGESRAHGNDERISPDNLTRGTELLWKIVTTVAAQGTH